jgi:hypothetical protein
MKNIQVFDPALCCSIGVCGVDVDQELVRFSADVDWARKAGATIERFNLAQQPMVFADNAAVKGFLESAGQQGLPLVLVNGQVRASGRYPTRDELAAWAGLVRRDRQPEAAKAGAGQAISVIPVQSGGCCAPSAKPAETAAASRCC